MNNQIITEITPLSDKDCFYLVDRYKDRFTFPVHRHEEYELNFCRIAREPAEWWVIRLRLLEILTSCLLATA